MKGGQVPTRRFHDTSPGWPKFLGRTKKARLTPGGGRASPSANPAGRAGMDSSHGRARGRWPGPLFGRPVELIGRH